MPAPGRRGACAGPRGQRAVNRPPTLDQLLQTLSVPSTPIDAGREPDLRVRLGAIAAEADALAVEHPDHAAELRFLAGFVRRILKA